MKLLLDTFAIFFKLKWQEIRGICVPVGVTVGKWIGAVVGLVGTVVGAFIIVIILFWGLGILGHLCGFLKNENIIVAGALILASLICGSFTIYGLYRFCKWINSTWKKATLLAKENK